jgi:hypothetical protein
VQDLAVEAAVDLGPDDARGVTDERVDDVDGEERRSD